MTEQQNQEKEYVLSWDYIENLGSVLSEEFDNFDRDEDGNNRLSIRFNDNVKIPEDLKVKSSEVRGYLMGVAILAMTKVIERGYAFPPTEQQRFINQEGEKNGQDIR